MYNYNMYAVISTRRRFCLRNGTYDLNDLCQQDSIGDVLTQVLDEALTARLGQVVIGPVSINLQEENKHCVSVCMSV